jgi:hypothetical protein
MTEPQWQLAYPYKAHSKTYVKYALFNCDNPEVVLNPLPISGKHNFVIEVQNFEPCIRATAEQHRTISEQVIKTVNELIGEVSYPIDIQGKLTLRKYLACIDTHWVNNADLLASMINTKSEKELKGIKDSIQSYEVISLTVRKILGLDPLIPPMSCLNITAGVTSTQSTSNQ